MGRSHLKFRFLSLKIVKMIHDKINDKKQILSFRKVKMILTFPLEIKSVL